MDQPAIARPTDMPNLPEVPATLVPAAAAVTPESPASLALPGVLGHQRITEAQHVEDIGFPS